MAGIVPKRVLEDIRFRCDIVEVIGSYLTLKRTGSTYKTLCPFHKEKTPSFHVNPQRQIYHCFGCGAGGDVFNFVMQQEGVDFMTSVRMLADRAGVELEIEEDSEGRSDKAAMYKIHAEVAELYHEALLERKSAERARKYLASRKLDDEIIKAFRIGYAPDRWDAVLTWAKKNGYGTEMVERAGLIIKSSKGGPKSPRHYDRFRNRLMFPITDEQDRIIGFSGRALDDADKSAKYVNSPETPLFHKGRVLYALSKARKAIVDCREAVICEGQIDVIRCHQAGFTTAVAAQGTAFTDDHIRVLKRYADSVVLAFDPDKAGQDAAIRSGRTFMSAGLAVRVVSLPSREDPDSFILKHGGEAFGSLLENASSMVSYQIQVLGKRERLDTEVGTMRVARAVLETVRRSPNAVQKAKLVQEAAKLLNLPVTALQEDLRHQERRNKYNDQRAAARENKDVAASRGAKLPAHEIQLCEHMAHAIDHPQLVEIVEKYLPLEMITDPTCRSFVQASLRAVHGGSDIQHVIREQDDRTGDLQELTARLLMEPEKVKGLDYSHEDAVQLLILFMWRERFSREREGLEVGDKRRVQLTHDLKALKDWSRGSQIIEMERE